MLGKHGGGLPETLYTRPEESVTNFKTRMSDAEESEESEESEPLLAKSVISKLFVRRFVGAINE